MPCAWPRVLQRRALLVSPANAMSTLRRDAEWSRIQSLHRAGAQTGQLGPRGAATWFRQRHWRRAARQHEADARAARSQLAGLGAGAVQRLDSRPLGVPPQGAHGVGGRDKQGATL